MAAIFVLVYVAVGAAVARGIVGGYRANRRVGARPRGAPYGPGSRTPEGRIHYAEGNAIPVVRSVGALGGAFVGLSAIGLVGFASGIGGLGWIALTLSATVLLILAVTLLGSKPGLRLYDNGLAIGHVTYAERHSGAGASARLGVPHPAAFLPYPDIAEVRIIDGVAAICAEQRQMARSAPTRVVGSRSGPMKVMGDFYRRGVPSAVYLRIRTDRLPEVPTQIIHSGPGRRQPALAVYWSGPEFLIGTRHPEALRAAVRSCLDPAIPVI